MAYATTNPPVLLGTQPIAGPKQWDYRSADAAAVVAADGYFTNGYDLGMRIQDTVLVMDTDTGLQTNHVVLDGTASTDVDLSDGLAVIDITNT